MESCIRLTSQPESNEYLARDPLTFKPLTSSEWPNFTRLFEEHGIQNGCWCMYWRVARVIYHQGFGDENKQAFKAIVDRGRIPGIFAYLRGQPVAWCSIAPRADFPVLERSRTLKPVDNLRVWSITCFFVSKPFRRQGLTEILIQAAVSTLASKAHGSSKRTHYARRSPSCCLTKCIWGSNPLSNAPALLRLPADQNGGPSCGSISTNRMLIM